MSNPDWDGGCGHVLDEDGYPIPGAKCVECYIKWFIETDQPRKMRLS